MNAHGGAGRHNQIRIGPVWQPHRPRQEDSDFPWSLAQRAAPGAGQPVSQPPWRGQPDREVPGSRTGSSQPARLVRRGDQRESDNCAPAKRTHRPRILFACMQRSISLGRAPIGTTYECGAAVSIAPTTRSLDGTHLQVLGKADDPGICAECSLFLRRGMNMASLWQRP